MIRGLKRDRRPLSRGWLLALSLILLFPTLLEARVYIDITSPGFREIPIAVYDFMGAREGEEIARIVGEDLSFSGIFSPVDKDAFIETPLPVFDPANWLPLGVELVMKGSVSIEGERIDLTMHLYDVVEARKVLQKRYTSERRFLRVLAHSIANDIYRRITGQDGVFRTKIAFLGFKGERRHLYIADWDGKRLRETGITGTNLLRPHWQSDGKRLLYSDARGMKWGVFLLDFQKRKEFMIYSSAGINLAGDFLPDGKGFLFSSSIRGTPDIYIYNLATRKKRRITRWLGIEISPVISPDGGEIAFVSDHGGTPQIYRMGLDGRGLRRVTFEGSYNTSPDWSPRGDRIAYSGRINGRNQIFLVRPDGTDPVQLTERGNNEEPVFSPDGRFIAFTSDRTGHKAVYIMRADGSGQKRISPKRMRAFGPSWSPNKNF